jgi:phage/plasmid-like protein (TIGR03299 family)
MLIAAKLNWIVEKHPAYADVNGDKVDVGYSALVRMGNSTGGNDILDVVSNDWEPVQNYEAFDFFYDFIMAGDMKMHTAGSLQKGKIVWGLAKINESFELFNGDVVESYLLFTNFHKYGYSTDIRFTPTRVVCQNTLAVALSERIGRMAKFTHRNKFDPELAKEILNISTIKMEEYKEMAQFLGSRQAKNEDIITYFKRIFPVSDTSEKELSRNAIRGIELVETQPGAEFAAGSWWQNFNAVSYMTDHLIGRSVDTRLTSAWYGQNRILKNKALDLALEMAA